MGRQRWRINQQEGFVILMGRRWAPVERTRDHKMVVDHSNFVVQFVAGG
jgi:hypothetical protein